MGRIVIYRNDHGITAATDSPKFTNTVDILNLINKSSFKVLNYEKDNLFLRIDELKVKIENYSTFMKEPILYDFNRRVRTNILKLERKMKLKKEIHTLIKVNSKDVMALFLGTVIVFKILTPNLDYDFSKEEKYENIVTEQPVSITVERVAYTAPKIENENLKKYSSDFGIPYQTALSLMSINTVNLNDTAKVLDVLYEYSKENVAFVENNLNKQQIEALILKYADILGIDDENVITTMIAAFRLETGHGQSDLYEKNNNFGGHRSYSKEDEKYYFKTYQTPEIGAYRHVQVFLEIMYYSQEVEKQKMLEEGEKYVPKTLEEMMNPTYCGEDWWHESVSALKIDVEHDYEHFFRKMVR